MTDKDAFCRHIRLCEKAMYALAFSLVRNESDAAEVIGESVYRAFSSLHTLKNDAAFKPWVLRIVHNTAVEMLRKNAKVTPMEELPDAADDSDEHDVATKLALRDAVEHLQPPYRTVVILFYYENLSVAQIAQIRSTNMLAVRQQLSRARKMLREILKEDFVG